MSDDAPIKKEETTTTTTTVETVKPTLLSDDTADQSRFMNVSVRALIVLILVLALCVIEVWRVFKTSGTPSNEFIILVSGAVGVYVGQKMKG